MLEKLGGGVSADELAQTRTSLAQARSQLAETLEKEAELEARRKVSLATLKASEAKLLHLAGQAAAITGIPLPENPADDAALEVWSKINVVEVRAGTAGIVHTFSVVSGALVDQHGPVLTVINPEQVRFRARVMLSDLGRLRDGMQARIAPPQGAYVHMQDTMSGTITLDPAANPQERTLDILLMPESLGAWARPGVAAHLEITLAGGGEELAIPVAAVCRDGNTPIIFRRDPSNPDKVIRLEADLGVSDGRWIVIKSGVAEGNEVVVDGVYQLLLATSGSAPKGATSTPTARTTKDRTDPDRVASHRRAGHTPHAAPSGFWLRETAAPCLQTSSRSLSGTPRSSWSPRRCCCSSRASRPGACRWMSSRNSTPPPSS